MNQMLVFSLILLIAQKIEATPLDDYVNKFGKWIS